MDNRMTSVEIQAYSVDEAVRLALEQLGLSQNEVDIEVLAGSGPDEDEEALVRVTAKGKASQPTQSPAARPARREPGPRRVPGDRPSSRGVPPQIELRPPSERTIDPDRVDSEEETVAKEVVRELLAHMGIAAEVVAMDNPSQMPVGSDDPATIYLDILGHDLGMLIGHRGDNLAQLQYMVNLLCNRRIGEWKRVVVDVEGYRGRREESLISLAERVARQVARGGRPIVLEPMPANERRIIHLTLKEYDGVQTESSGEGHDRRITVLPRE